MPNRQTGKWYAPGSLKRPGVATFWVADRGWQLSPDNLSNTHGGGRLCRGPGGCNQVLKEEPGDHLIYDPLPNLLINSCGDWCTIRTSLEVAGWAMQAFMTAPLSSRTALDCWRRC
jgi:hypothetical protein